MLAQRYNAAPQDSRSSPARTPRSKPAKVAKSGSSDSHSRKSNKVNAVSKASLAMLDPRHAMGIDVGLQWHESPTIAYKTRYSAEEEQGPVLAADVDASNVRIRHLRSESPTPTLEAFLSSTEESSNGSTAFDDVCDMDARSGISASPRGRSQLDLDSPPRSGRSSKPPKSHSSSGNSGTSGGGGSSSIARFFTWKKKDKPNPPGVDGNRSTSDLFDATLPQSAPPTTTTFDIHSHAPLIPGRSILQEDHCHSLPCSPERGPATLPQEAVPASMKATMPPLREIRAALAAERKSSYGKDQSRTARETVSALPFLSIDIATSSPMMPDIFNKWGVSSPDWDVRTPPSCTSPPKVGSGGRTLSSVGRGVPGRDRKSTIILKSEAEVRQELMSRAPPLPISHVRVHPVIVSGQGKGHARRTSIAKHVVEGLMIENRGREEPTLPSQLETGLNVRANRRRSRSVDGRAPPSLASFGIGLTGQREADLASPPVETAVFPGFVRHVAQQQQQQPPPSSHQGLRSRKYVEPVRPRPDAREPAPAQRPARRSPASPAARPQAPARGVNTEGQTHQARRVHLSNQRARAVAVASPTLITRSPRMVAPLPVVNIMPPTPEPELDDVSSSTLAEVVDQRVADAVEAVTLPASSVDMVSAELETGPAGPVKDTIGSPSSIYSAGKNFEEGRFSCAYGGIDSAIGKDLPDLVGTIRAAGRPRTNSMHSEASELSSSGSSSSGAFAFSDSLSNSSLVSGGSFSSISSMVSDSPDHSIKNGGGGLPRIPQIVISSSASLQSLTAASLDDSEASSTQSQLRTPFHYQSSTKSFDESDDCETPTLASCREMSATSQTQTEGKRLDLDMDLSDLARELGLGRLSRILPASAAFGDDAMGGGKAALPSKPPKSPARNVSQWRRSITSDAYDPNSVHFAFTSPLSFKAADRSPLTPPRTPYGQTTAGSESFEAAAPGATPSAAATAAAVAAMASNVPTVPGGMGLGLDFGMAEPSSFHHEEHYHHVAADDEEEWGMGFAL